MEIAVKSFICYRFHKYPWFFFKRRAGKIDPLFLVLLSVIVISIEHITGIPRHQNHEKRLTIRFFHIIILKVFYVVQTSQKISYLPVRHIENIGNNVVIQRHSGGKIWEQTFYPFVRACMFKWKKITPAGARPFSFSVPGPMCAPDAQIAGGNWWWDESNLKKRSNAF